MKQNTLFLSILFLALTLGVAAQVPMNTAVQILKAEDARRYDVGLEGLMRSPSAAVRARAALASGRIGHENAIPLLTTLLTDESNEVRTMAAFAIGEIESIKGADAVLKALADTRAETRAVESVQNTHVRLLEAAGKIAAAHPRDPKSKELGEAILQTLQAEPQNREIILLGITSVLRARPEKSDVVVVKFLTHPDARIRADAANMLSRVRAKNANPTLRAMLVSDTDAVARANAARALGAAEDKDAFDLLLKAATSDADSRVRVSAIRSLVSLKNEKAGPALIEHGEALVRQAQKAKRPNFIPVEQSEFIEVATALGRLMAKSRNERVIKLFAEFAKIDNGFSTEVYLARMRVGRPPGATAQPPELVHWRQYSTLAQVIGEMTALDFDDEEFKQAKSEAPDLLRPLAVAFASADPAVEGKRILAGPDVLAAYARFKSADLAEILRSALFNKDTQIRATAARLLGDIPASKENIGALESAFAVALLTDKRDNDAQLAIMGALFKLDKKGVHDILRIALDSPDYLVRKRAIELLRNLDVKEAPQAPIILKNALAQDKEKVLPYRSTNITKQGQILNSDSDYRRALSRKNGSIKAVLRTEKGTFTIDFMPDDAPLTVDNFVKLARSGYFNGLEVHRVVSNFVMQDGDPRGDGNGGPGWSIRCEVNMRGYGRGAVGMALSGKDTGGSQWFATHSPQPHLDGGYTVFGQVSEKDMGVVDKIVRGDKIISVRVIESPVPLKGRRK